MTYMPQPQKIEGGQPQSVVSDDAAQQILEDILKELKKMNIQLTLLTDNRVTDQEIE